MCSYILECNRSCSNIRIYQNIFTYIYIHTHTHTYIHIYILIYMHTNTHIHIHTYVHCEECCQKIPEVFRRAILEKAGPKHRVHGRNDQQDEESVAHRRDRGGGGREDFLEVFERLENAHHTPQPEEAQEFGVWQLYVGLCEEDVADTESDNVWECALILECFEMGSRIRV